MWKTADGDNILQLVGSSKTCIAHTPSAVVSEILNSHNANHILTKFKPDLRTANGDTILEVVCQSRRIVSQISSTVLIKWFGDSNNLMKIVPLEGNTADGNNLLELVCESEKCLTQLSSTVFMKWLRKNILYSVTIAIPDCETSDGDTLLQLILRSEMSISRISSQMLAKLLSNSRKITINEMKNVSPNWKTVDEAHFPHALCLTNVESNKLIELMQYFILENGWNPETSDSEGNTVLHLACQIDKLPLVSYLIEQAQCNPNRENGEGSLPVDTTTSLRVIKYLCQHHQVSVSSKTITEWLNNPMIDDTTMLCILQSLVENHKTVTMNKDGSTLLHVVCTCSRSRDTMSLVDYLLTECQCDPNSFDSKGQMPLQLTSDIRIMKTLVEHGAKMTTDVVFKVIKMRLSQSKAVELFALSSRKGAMLWHPTDLNRNGQTALDLAFSLNKPIVSFLLTEAKCDSSADNLLKSLLKLTTNLNVAKLLIEHGARVTPELVLRFEAMEAAPNKAVLLELMLTTWNPDDKDSDGYTVLHLACKAGNPALVELLISVAHCDPNVKSKNEEVPIQLTTDLRIMKILIEHGAQMTTDVVLNLISMHNTCTDSRVSDLFNVLTRKGTVVMYPNDLNNINDGYNALHLACKSDRFTIVKFLLTVAHCDPNAKSKNEEVPILLISDLSIMKKLVEHGTQMTIDVVFKLISMHNSNFSVPDHELFKILTTNGTWNPNDFNSDGYTALHLACKVNNLTIAKFLLSVAHCDPNVKSKNEEVPIQLTSDLEIMEKLVEHGAQMTIDVVFKLISMCSSDFRVPKLLKLSKTKGTMIWNPNVLNSDGYTALHLACKADSFTIVNFLLSLDNCEPNAESKNEEVPIQLTSDLSIMKKLVEYGAQMTTDVVFKLISMHSSDFRVPELLTLSIRKGTMSWNPNDLNSDGYTALHLACQSNIFPIVNILLSLAHCDPNIKSKNQEVPIQLTSDLRTIKKLVEYGAQMTTDVVFKLISMHSSDSRVPELFNISTRKGTMLWNSNGLNSDGYTALHLACQADNFAIINYLLSVAQCDPNYKSESKEMCLPLQLTTNTEIIKALIRHGAKTNIMYESNQNPLGTKKPIQPPVKVFVIGNPYVGKSTLTAALKTEKKGIIARLVSSGRVTDVDKNTVGIVPHDLESEIFGRVTLYDFAGHREFYSGHAALLQTAIQSTPPMFIVVVNFCEDEDEIIKQILYWVSFLENQCASVSCNPHIILVGSHADTLKGVNPNDKIKMITDSLDTNHFTNMEYVGFVAMNCQYHESAGMNDLRHLLIKSCEQLRIQEPITFNAHCFLVYLIDTFIDLPAVTIKAISEKIENQQEKGVLEFLPKDIEALHKICLEPYDRGHILLLKDQAATENSLVVINKTFLLSEISGTMFAPEGFTQYTRLSTNSGVVPRSKLADSFPSKDLNIVIGYLNHLEFCHEIVDQALYQLISKEYSQTYDRKERYFLFPGLVSVKAEDSVWKTESHFEHNFGWILKCVNDEQFFSSRFLQVLLLRLAFSFALKVSGSDHTFGIHRKCSIWKNGIFWGRNFNMDVLVEVTDNKSVTLIARFGTSNLLKSINQRSEVILTILECVKQFCPRVETVESFIDSSSALQYPLDLNSDRTLCSVRDLSEALVSSCECPSVVLSDSGKSIPAESFLSNEPYSEIEPQLLQVLWDMGNESNMISDTFLSRFVKKSLSKLNWFVNIFNDSASVPSCKDDLKQWRDSEKTNKDFRHKLDKYSVFAGRNILVSIRDVMIIMHKVCGFTDILLIFP
jgi:ankyrin repeat protein